MTIEEARKQLDEKFTKEELIDRIMEYVKDQSFDDKGECSFMLGIIFDGKSGEYDEIAEAIVDCDLSKKEVLF